MTDSTLSNTQEDELRAQIKKLVIDGVLEADITSGKDKPLKIGYPISVIDAIMSLISSYTKQARKKLIEDIKTVGYGYDDGTGFMLNISFAELAAIEHDQES